MRLPRDALRTTPGHPSDSRRLRAGGTCPIVYSLHNPRGLTSLRIRLFYWVPSYLGIYGNEIVDKLAKKGLFGRKIKSSYTSLSYIGRVVREKILE